MSALGHQRIISQRLANVRFTPESRHGSYHDRSLANYDISRLLVSLRKKLQKNGSAVPRAQRIVPAPRALSAAGIGPVADEAMSARYRPAAANGRTVALPHLSIVILFISALCAAMPALAAADGSRAASQVLFIAELALLLVVGRLMGEAALRLGQPSVMGQLIGGLLLGPSFFGLIWPDAQHAIFPSDAAQKSIHADRHHGDRDDDGDAADAALVAETLAAAQERTSAA